MVSSQHDPQSHSSYFTVFSKQYVVSKCHFDPVASVEYVQSQKKKKPEIYISCDDTNM